MSMKKKTPSPIKASYDLQEVFQHVAKNFMAAYKAVEETYKIEKDEYDTGLDKIYSGIEFVGPSGLQEYCNLHAILLSKLEEKTGHGAKTIDIEKGQELQNVLLTKDEAKDIGRYHQGYFIDNIHNAKQIVEKRFPKLAR